MNKSAKNYSEVLEWDSNAIVQTLVGAFNANIERIERKLDVEIKMKGNRFVVEGRKPAVEQARRVLLNLYEKAETSDYLDEAEVDSVLRFAEQGEELPPAAKPKDMSKQEVEGTVLRTRKKHIVARSPIQAEYMQAMNRCEMVIGLGPAGTGKTYLAVAQAVCLMLEGKIERIILTRPAVEAAERLGFLPGDLKEKIDPYLMPLYDALYDMLPNEMVDKKIETGEIEIAPLAFMRGRTLANAMVILDEAQNTTPMQMKMFLTRLGQHSRMAINGDLSQTDLPPGVKSGLADALEVLKNVPGIETVKFTDKDVVRHGLVAQIVCAYEQRNRQLRGY